MRLRPLLVSLSIASAAALGCGGSPSPQTAPQESDFAVTDFPEDSLLPTAGDWLDVPRALAGVGQFDRLKGTIHDDAKCSTMVALSAAVVGGKSRFLALVDDVARKRAGHSDDLLILDGVRAAVAAQKLTPRHLHDFTEVIVRAFGVEYGAYDSQIAAMVRASGYVAIPVGSRKPEVLVEALDDGDVVPLGTIADGEAHITLLWKDARGVVRLYDSDDVHGSHVMPRDSVPYRKRIEDPQSSWDRAEKYR